MMQTVFDYLFIIALYFAVIGLAFFFSWGASWVFRKLSARLQARRGPPAYQPIADIIKLFGKERFTPALSNKFLYILSPLLALSAILILSFMIPPGTPLWPGPLAFDLIVILYFSVMFSLAFVIAGWASGSTWGKIGASREVVMILSVELPLAIALLIPSLALARGGFSFSLSITDVISAQQGTFIWILPNWFLFRYPLAAIALFLTLLTKSWMRPFGDIPEAEQEIFAGSLTEYGGPLLGIFELARLFRFYVFTALFVDLYLGGGVGFVFPFDLLIFLAKCLVIVILMTIVHVASARYRISHVFKWFLTVCLAFALFSLIRVLVGF
ncbi:NADH-quinone oxidoreductase subunit H [Candidatus Bathyarchaeota archaeon]|nr:NADH-quinone oxidoreductase subunit H [Candidatus Bathyarchaeota archaeon]